MVLLVDMSLMKSGGGAQCLRQFRKNRYKKE